MAKKILILESSVTIQKLFTNSLDAKEYTVKFETSADKVFSTLLKFQPDIFFLNSDIQEPRSYEIVKIIRRIDGLGQLPVAIYSNIPASFEERFAKESGADDFIILEPETLKMKIDLFVQIRMHKSVEVSDKTIPKSIDESTLFKNASKLLTDSSFSNVILSEITNLVNKIENLEEMIKSYLLLIAQVCEVPVVSMYIMENDGPHGYYISSSNIDNKDISDFLEVCFSDFEKNQKDGLSKKAELLKIDTKGTLNKFYRSEIKLSSYEYSVLKANLQVIGTVHIVTQGNLTKEKQNYLDFCIKNGATIFDKALVVEKKIFFEKRIRRAFSRFVPEQIIDNLVMQADNTDEKIGVGETRAVAILFSDIRSFTNISEKNRADVLVAFLNRYFSTMVEIIKKHGGTIDKFIGDAIMAEFGTPVSYEDNCRRAVMAAYEMRDALETVEMGDLVMPDGMKFNIGIGIHYGDVIVGSIGSKDKTDYSVIGDNVNLASRLEGLTKTYGTQILVSESVRDDVIVSSGEGAFCFRHLDDVRVKGKKNAVPIYAVDRNEEEFPASYKDAYIKGMELYTQGIWNLAKDYFVKALDAVHEDKAAKLMLERCEEFIKNPPENWDGAIAFMTK